MLGDGVVDCVGQQFAQHFAADLALVARAHDGSGRVSGTKAGNFRGLAVFLTDAIVGTTDLGRFNLDSDLLASWGDVNKFGFHFVGSSLWCERGDSNPHTFRYQILSLARLPIPPLSQFVLLQNDCTTAFS